MLIQCLKTVWTKAPCTVRDPQKHTAIEWLTAYLKQRSNQKCVTCNSKMINKLVFNDTPLFLAFYAKDVDIAWNASINFAQQKYMPDIYVTRSQLKKRTNRKFIMPLAPK